MPLTRFPWRYYVRTRRYRRNGRGIRGCHARVELFGPGEIRESRPLPSTIVALAKQGERNPVRLQQRAIEALSGTPPDPASA